MAAAAAAVAGGAGPSRSKKAAGALGIGARKRNQLATLQSLVTKHVVDPALVEIAETQDFTITSLERGIPRYEHAHLVAALDVILTYQRDRRANGCGFMSMRKSYRHDPRTRVCELFKRWLRTNAANSTIGEDEVRRMCSLCRDILNYGGVFPSKNSRSFMQTLAEVFDHMQLQLKEVLKRDRTCAELAAGALSISRNLISDAIAYILLAATDLHKTDRLPSLEVVALWQSLPADGNPLPGRADAELQSLMKEHWKTLCGSLVAELLRQQWAFRLFGGASAQDEAASARAMLADGPRGAPAPLALTQGGEARGRSQSVPPARGAQDGGDRTLARARSSSAERGGGANAGGQTPSGIAGPLSHAKEQFDKNRFSNSGLAGPFRESSQGQFRSSYLAAVQAIDELMYLLGVVLVHFQRISEGLGDYGMIRVAPWLHPILEALASKVQTLKGCLEAISKGVDQELVIAKARGRKVKSPAPTDRQSARAHASIERAVTGRDSHVSALLQLLEDLKARSAPERMPALMDNLGEACTQLEGVLSSQQFRLCVGDKFPTLPSLRDGQVLAPPLGDAARPQRAPAAIESSQVQIEEVLA